MAAVIAAKNCHQLGGRLRRTAASSIAVTAVVATLMALALAYWLWFGLGVRGIHFDDGVSILATQGILEHGYSKLPSGFFYNRGHIPHYLVAGSIQVFGLNNLSIMLPSLVMGLGSLLMVHLIAKGILGRPWLGVAAIILLLALEMQTWYATGPRMYMTLQFFTLLAVYSTWRGHVEGRGKFKVLAVLAIIAAMLSHREAVILVVALPATALILMWLKGQEWSKILSFQNVLSLLPLVLVTLLVLGVGYDVPNPMQTVVIHDGNVPARQGLNLNPVFWGKHFIHLERTLPYGIALLPIAYFAAFKSFRRNPSSSHSLIYLLLVFTFTLFLLGLVAKDQVGSRFLFFVLPINALLVCTAGVAVVQFLVPRANKLFQVSRVDQVVVLVLLLGGITMSVALGTLQAGGGFVGGSATRHAKAAFAQGPQPAGLASLGFGTPCGKPSRTCRNDGLTALYADLRHSVQPDDLVISATPMETNFYLGSVDGYLRERKTKDGELTTFDQPTDEYFGANLIDSLEELRELRDSNRRVWVIASSTSSHISQESLDLLDNTFQRYGENGHLLVYVNRMAEETSGVR